MLAAAGVRAVTLSHGSPGVAEAGLSRGGVLPLVERTLTSESIRAWKPNREAYLWAAGVCGVAPDRLALGAAPGWDVPGPQRGGPTGAGLSPPERPYPQVFEPPDGVGDEHAGAAAA